MTKQEALKIINQVGENFGWQVGKVGANYENGYMKAIRDCKFALQNAKDDFVEVNKMVDHSGYFQNGKNDIVESNKMITNADRIRSMTDEELVKCLICPHCIVKSFKCNIFEVNCKECILKWLKEKVE